MKITISVSLDHEIINEADEMIKKYPDIFNGRSSYINTILQNRTIKVIERKQETRQFI